MFFSVYGLNDIAGFEYLTEFWARNRLIFPMFWKGHAKTPAQVEVQIHSRSSGRMREALLSVRISVLPQTFL